MTQADREDKIVRKQAADAILLNNKCARATRKKHKRITSKAARQAQQRKRDDE